VARDFTAALWSDGPEHRIRHQLDGEPEKGYGDVQDRDYPFLHYQRMVDPSVNRLDDAFDHFEQGTKAASESRRVTGILFR
jgi:hypothetical protein